MCERHIDHIILCSIYGVTRLDSHSSKVIKFNNMLPVYTLMPHFRRCGDKIYKHVSMKLYTLKEASNSHQSQSQPTDTIIKFYNLIFIKQVAQKILEICKKPQNVIYSPNKQQQHQQQQDTSHSKIITLASPFSKRTPSSVTCLFSPFSSVSSSSMIATHHSSSPSSPIQRRAKKKLQFNNDQSSPNKKRKEDK